MPVENRRGMSPPTPYLPPLCGGHEAVSDNVLVRGELLLDLLADHAEGEYVGQAEPPDHDPPDVLSSVLARQGAGQVHGKLIRPGEGRELVPPTGHHKGLRL